MRFLFLVFLSISTFFMQSCTGKIISINDPNWYFTEYNWYKDPSGQFAQSANPGSYFKIGVQDTTAIALSLDTSGTPSSPFLTLRYSIDDAPYIEVVLPSSSNPIVLATNISANANHNLILFIMNSLQSVDRWKGPQCKVSVLGLVVDDGAFTVAPNLRPARMLIYWDSIGEGVRVLGASGGDLEDNDGTETWAMALATAMLAEVSVVAFGRQGYNVTGNGGVPALFTPGNDEISAWDKYDSQHSRLNEAGLLDPPPDYIFCGHGTNDALQGVADQIVIDSALGWMTAQRKAAPQSNIFVVIPFGTFKEQAIEKAYALYQQNSVDSTFYKLNLGPEAAQGVSKWGATRYSGDGIHPLAPRDGQLGALLATQAIQALQSK